jgi:carbohydrate kinase (thermoresistant glucokinase family)
MVLILMGPMGCGKTTIGELLSGKLGWPFYDGDDFHPRANVEKMRSGIPLNDDDRRVWLEELRSRIEKWLQKGEDTILACSALKQSYRDILGVNQTTVMTAYLKGSYELLRERIEQRKHPYMNKGLLASQFETLEEPSDGIIADVSGTPEDTVNEITRALSALRANPGE